MPKIYSEGNYLVIDSDDSGVEDVRSSRDVTFIETTDAFYVVDVHRKLPTLKILIADAADWDNDSAVAYSESTLRALLVSVTKPVGEEEEEDTYNFEQALSFDGVDDLISFSAITPSEYTVSYWFKPDTNSGLIAHLNRANQPSVFNGFTSSTAFRINNGTAANFTVPAIVTGNWYHLMYVHTGTQIRLFLNGVESSTGVIANTDSLNTNQFARYNTGAGVNFFDGNLDDLVIDSAAVANPATAASDLYNGGAGVDPTTVIASPDRWYKVDGNGNDSGSDAANLTITGATFTAH